MSELKRKMIIDCDTGTDDAVAVLGLLLADNIDVIGIQVFARQIFQA